MQTQAATLRLAVFPRSSLLTDALLVCAGAGFVALCAQVSIHLGFTPVPITLRPFPLRPVPSPYGAPLGTARMPLYPLAATAGAPVCAERRQAWGVFPAATAGYTAGCIAL